MSVITFINSIREHELICALEQAKEYLQLRNSDTLLEIGAGTGQQAKTLSSKGFNVIALDLQSSAYKNNRVFPVQEYDGINLPCEPESISTVFSSNVLEHVENIDEFLDEIYRVLEPNGYAIHILPTPSCRFWSIISHYGWIIKKGVFFALQKTEKTTTQLESSETSVKAPRTIQELMSIIFPLRHGERGNTITEMYYYSEYWWLKKFKQHGYEIKKNLRMKFFTQCPTFLNFHFLLKYDKTFQSY